MKKEGGQNAFAFCHTLTPASFFEDNRYSLVGIIFIGSGDIAGKDAEYAGNLFQVKAELLELGQAGFFCDKDKFAGWCCFFNAKLRKAAEHSLNLFCLAWFKLQDETCNCHKYSPLYQRYLHSNIGQKKIEEK